MKKTLILITLIFTFFSCSTYKGDKFEDSKKGANDFINTFKDEAFYACLREGYQNDTITKLMAEKDLFNTNENYDFEMFYKAITVGKAVGAHIPPAKIIIYDESMRGKKFISQTCLHYYASRELDSIAKDQYKVYLKDRKMFKRALDSIQKANLKSKKSKK